MTTPPISNLSSRLSLSKAWAVVLGVYTLWILRTAEDWHLLDNINLPIHETGHLVFAWGGEILAALGGTLFQLIVPLVFLGYFLRRRDRTGAASSLWWAGQNGFYIATYLSDARAQELPLVGGGEHDWAFLLGEWGLLEQDIVIGRGVRIVALLTMIGSVVWIWRAARDSRLEIREG